MSAQTSYEYDMTIGLEGQIASTSPRQVVTRLSEEIVPFGRVMVLGTDKDKQCKSPQVNTDLTNGDKVLGISTATATKEDDPTKDFVYYRAKDAVNLLRKGQVYMKTESAIQPGDTVHVRYATDQEEQTLTWDIDFVADNKINGKINGVSISEVVFTTDQATTLNLLRDAIALNPDVDSATVTDFREITIVTVADKKIVLSDFVVIDGTAQPVATIVETVAGASSTDLGKIRGDSVASQTVEASYLKCMESAGANELALIEINL
jgi:hypothetical protein